MGGIGTLVPAPDGELTVADLERVVVDLVAHPELWRDHVRHAPDQRLYTQLHREPHLDIWLICWDASQETGLHDHDRSSGAVGVVEERCSRTTSPSETGRSCCRPSHTALAQPSLSTRPTSTTSGTTAAYLQPRSTPTRPRSGAWGTTRWVRVGSAARRSPTSKRSSRRSSRSSLPEGGGRSTARSARRPRAT